MKPWLCLEGRSERNYAPTSKSDAIVAPGEGKDMAVRRAIPVNGGTVTVTGNAARSGAVALMGERAIPDPDGNFVIQRIMPPGSHNIAIGLNGQEITRRVDIPNSDWFYVGMADLTVGFETGGDSYTIGRVAGYAKGVDQRGNPDIRHPYDISGEEGCSICLTSWTPKTRAA
ncbi:MAG: hypothetical protein U5N55_13880 [Cypionkella sp.]|nr:hypothetical protein [Cypionkella sp.]